MSDARLRVLQLGKFFSPYRGGIETYLKMLCDELRDEVDMEVLVANTAPRTIRETVDDVPVTRTASLARLCSTPITPRLPIELAQARADVVHLHAPNPAAELAYLTSPLARRSRLVVTWHSDVVRQTRLARLYRPVTHRLLSRADAICVATPRHVRASSVLPDYADKCHVCTFGVDLATTEAAPEAVSAIRRRFGDRPIVLGVGRLVYYKGFELLVEAVRDLDATLLIVGEGERRPDLTAAISRHGMEKRAFLLGEQPDVRPYFAACDVFVLPSTHRSEAFGIVQLEAMAAGKPVVGTRLGTGTEYVNRDGETGLVMPPGDARALGSAIGALLANEGLRRRMGAAGRSRVEREFTTARAAADVLAIYRRVAGGRPAASECPVEIEPVRPKVAHVG